MQTIITDLRGFACGDHFIDLTNVGVKVPAGSFPMTVEGGTVLTLARVFYCPECKRKFNTIVLAEDWPIWFEGDEPAAQAPAPAAEVVYEEPDDPYGDPAFAPSDKYGPTDLFNGPGDQYTLWEGLSND